MEVTCGASETRVAGLATARIAPVSRMDRCDNSRGSLRGFETAKFASDVRATQIRAYNRGKKTVVRRLSHCPLQLSREE